jgi:chromosome segregation ATPase
MAVASSAADLPPVQFRPPSTDRAMAKLEELAERVDRLLLRHDELTRTNSLLEQQLQAVSQERDSLRSRLNAARGRIDLLLQRLPADPSDRSTPEGSSS